MGLPDSAAQQAKAIGHPYAQSGSDGLTAGINKLIYDNCYMIAHDWRGRRSDHP